jgi:hypothetical protein
VELFDGLDLTNSRCSDDGCYPFTGGYNVNGCDLPPSSAHWIITTPNSPDSCSIKKNVPLSARLHLFVS